MNRAEVLDLLGEKTALERMIAETPAEDVIDRASLAARLEAVEKALVVRCTSAVPLRTRHHETRAFALATLVDERATKLLAEPVQDATRLSIGLETGVSRAPVLEEETDPELDGVALP